MVEDAPVYGKSRLRAADLAEIRRLRDQDQTMASIAQRFGWMRATSLIS
jgi:hypothetical protein